MCMCKPWETGRQGDRETGRGRRRRGEGDREREGERQGGRERVSHAHV